MCLAVITDASPAKSTIAVGHLGQVLLVIMLGVIKTGGRYDLSGNRLKSLGYKLFLKYIA